MEKNPNDGQPNRQTVLPPAYSPNSLVTRKELLTHTKERIPVLDAELLLAHVLDISREQLIMHPEKSVSFWARMHFLRLVKKRSGHTPLAYLVGEKAFFGRTFLVNKHTLTPRPETEILIEEVLKEIDEKGQAISLVDVGTGTGCIPITIKKERPDTDVFAIDISKSALKVAKKNAEKHGADITFLHGSLLKPFAEKALKSLQAGRQAMTNDRRLLITANLPYLTDEEMTEPSIQREPTLALYGGHDGLNLYRQMMDQIPGPCTIFFELNPTQVEALQEIVLKRYAEARMSVIPDLAGKARVVKVEIENEKMKDSSS